MNYQKDIIGVLDRIRNHNLYIHNDTIDELSFNLPDFKKRKVYLVETLATINALVKNGTLLLYGGHGGGKTTLAKYLGRVFRGKTDSEIEKAILRCHPELTEEKILGTLNFKQILSPNLIPDNGEIEVQWNEFVKSNWKIIDEINRLSHYAQNVLLSLLAEGVVKYHNQSRKVGNYTVFATMNPRDEGNVEIPLPFLDRFAMAIPITMPDYPSLSTIGKMDRHDKPEPELKLDSHIFEIVQEEVATTQVQNEAEEFINIIISDYKLCDRAKKEASENYTVETGLCTVNSECRYLTDEQVCNKIIHPLSVRVKEDLYRYGKAIAWFLGDKSVTKNHIKAIAPFMIWHRSNLNDKFLKENFKSKIEGHSISTNAQLEGTKAIVDKIYSKFNHRFKYFLVDYKKATQAKLSKESLDALIERCSEAEGDLFVRMELYKELLILRESYEAVVEYSEKIDKTKDIRGLQYLVDELSREYLIGSRQLLTDRIENKILKIQNAEYGKVEIKVSRESVFSGQAYPILLERIRDHYGATPDFSMPEKRLISKSKDSFKLEILPLDEDTLKFSYIGPKDCDLWYELESLKN
jgi:MoxR-like ATPase